MTYGFMSAGSATCCARRDLGWSMGTYLIQRDGLTGHGKYLSVWQKGRNGKWKFVQDAGSGNPPPGP